MRPKEFIQNVLIDGMKDVVARHPYLDKSEALKECENFLNSIAPGAILEPKKYGDLMQEIINENNKR